MRSKAADRLDHEPFGNDVKKKKRIIEPVPVQRRFDVGDREKKGTFLNNPDTLMPN